MNHARSIPLLALALSTAAFGQAPPSYDFTFSTVGALGNGAFNNPSYPFATVTNGRGRVDYAYRISTLETTTAQWMEFVNTYSTLGGSWTNFGRPSHWGAQIDLSYTGPGNRYELKNLPDAERFPVTGITWRTAAMFCNWLHNGKDPSVNSLQNGAYDASTFATNSNGTFNDQLTHHPSAKYWIPTLDEALKAAHYDPDRYGAGQGGWWLYPNMSDTPPVGGLPGIGQTNAGFELPQFGHWNIPLGAYPSTVSPWGLLDASGGTADFLEYTFFLGTPEERAIKGSSAGGDIENFDHANQVSSLRPGLSLVGDGLRIASAVPSPSGIVILACSSLPLLSRPRKPRARRGSIDLAL